MQRGPDAPDEVLGLESGDVGLRGAGTIAVRGSSKKPSTMGKETVDHWGKS